MQFVNSVMNILENVQAACRSVARLEAHGFRQQSNSAVVFLHVIQSRLAPLFLFSHLLTFFILLHLAIIILALLFGFSRFIRLRGRRSVPCVLAAVVPSRRPACTLRSPRQRTLVISVVLLASEALVAGGAAEAVVVGVRALMLQHVSATTERLLTELTLVWLYT